MARLGGRIVRRWAAEAALPVVISRVALVTVTQAIRGAAALSQLQVGAPLQGVLVEDGNVNLAVSTHAPVSV